MDNKGGLKPDVKALNDVPLKLKAGKTQPESTSPYPWMHGRDGLLSCSPRHLPRGLRRAYAIHQRAAKGGK